MIIGRLIGRDTWVVAKREFLSRARTKWFVIGTLLGPIGMVLMILVAGAARHLHRRREATRVQILDHGATSHLGPALVDGFTKLGWKPEVIAADTPEPTLRKRIRDKDINGYIDIPADALGSGETILSRR